MSGRTSGGARTGIWLSVRWSRLSIILMPALSWLASSFYDNDHAFFILETVCVPAFAVSFILKGHGQLGDPGLDRAAGRPPHTAIHPPNDVWTPRIGGPRDSLPGSLNAKWAVAVLAFLRLARPGSGSVTGLLVH
jgi:hypothetical protein